ncbi:sulfotransferase family protein [Roseinatronobacter sp.]|uniref:sulfotransferase family protein n=1 Tax=Roseinatronobacter sp. TaxID=1945755 RepID=UPI0025FDE23E|nr:sulfotransferase [Roseibaca sp.]
MDYLCNLILPGAPKSGTSTLHTALAEHPEICMSRPKEPWFFFGDRFKGGSEAHNALFSHSEDKSRVFGESSQGYFADHESMQRIADSLRQPKIILLLRNPVDRALSQYRYDVRRGIETDPLDKALKERGEDPSLIWDERVSFFRNVGGYYALSRYSEIVPQWQTLFGTENILLIQAEQYHADPAAILTRCHRFLGLTPISHVPLSAQTRNATSDTKRKVMPGPVRAVARLVPSGLKSSRLYRRLRGTVLQGITPPTPEKPGQATMRIMQENLVQEIAFHDGLKET